MQTTSEVCLRVQTGCEGPGWTWAISGLELRGKDVCVYQGLVVQGSASWSGRCFPKLQSGRADHCHSYTHTHTSALQQHLVYLSCVSVGVCVSHFWCEVGPCVKGLNPKPPLLMIPEPCRTGQTDLFITLTHFVVIKDEQHY